MEKIKFALTPIAFIRSPFKEKFAIPRQSGLVKQTHFQVVLTSDFSDPSLIKNLEGFSHLWLTFIFHANNSTWHPTVRPPRLGGNKRVGVFASRSPFRPNALGLSAVKLEKIEIKKQQIILHISGADLLEGTPIVDIRPYIKESDCLPKATTGWTAQATHPKLKVTFTKPIQDFLREKKELKAAIKEIIAQDPRPRYQEEKKNYAFKFESFDVHFEVSKQTAKVFDIKEIN